MTSTPAVVLYGATGYVAELVLRDRRTAALPIVLAGRPSAGLDAVGTRTGRAVHAAATVDPEAVARMLAAPAPGHHAAVLVNLAGPFEQTASPLAAACADRGVHYLDIAGEVGPFRSVAAHGDRAAETGAMLLPGAGFGVVPTDCLAARVHAAAPAATHLRIGFATRGGVSRGTLGTLAHDAPTRGFVHEDGALRDAPVELATWSTGDRDLGTLVQNPWRGDLLTVPTSLPGVQSVSCWFGVPGPVAGMLRSSRRRGSTAAGMRWAARWAPRGPSPRALARGRALVRVDACDAGGATLASETLQLADAYVVTVDAVIRIVERILDGDHRPGWCSPSSAYGTRPIDWLTG